MLMARFLSRVTFRLVLFSSWATVLTVSSGCKNLVALGDSITRAANVRANCQLSFDFNGRLLQLLPECADQNWSTGYVLPNSQYQRLTAALKPDLVSTFNQAVTAATSDGLILGTARPENSLLGQFNQFAKANPTLTADYVTIATGANDFCQKSTPLTAIAAGIAKNVSTAIKAIDAAGSSRVEPTRIVIAPVPDLVRLKQLMSAHPTRGKDCLAKWNGLIPFCPRYLTKNAGIKDADMKNAIISANNQLAEIEKVEFTNVIITYAKSLENYQISSSDVSEVDCFHPSIIGQRNIADRVWASGWTEKLD
jgi:lysophospholipase L1-like esterase